MTMGSLIAAHFFTFFRLCQFIVLVAQQKIYEQ